MPHLEAREDLREVVYHLKGILEAGDKIASLVQRLDSVIDADDRDACDIVALLEVEIYHQLDYHSAELRAPWDALVEKLNARLAETP
jgi:hypothetical protein